MGTYRSSSPSVVVAVEAGDGDGELIDPSTWMKAAQSTREAGFATLRFFLALVIQGEMTHLLLAGLVLARAFSTTSCPTATAMRAATEFSSTGGPC